MILNWVANGYKLPFTGSVEPFNIPPLRYHSPEEVVALREIKEKLLTMGVIRRTTNNTSTQQVSSTTTLQVRDAERC